MKEEGHYTIKRVEKLPTRGNSNWLYILKESPINALYRWGKKGGGYEEIAVGTPGTGGAGGADSYLSGATLSGTDLNFTGTGLAFNASVDLSSLGSGPMTGAQIEAALDTEIGVGWKTDEVTKAELNAAIIGVGTSAPPSSRTAIGGETTWDTGTTITPSHKLFVNGVKLIEGTDYTKSGSIYTFTGYTSVSGHIQESFPDVAVPASGGNSSIDWQGAWVNQNYVEDQAVSFNGTSYICILDTVSNEDPTNSTYWDVLAEAGINGADGVIDGIALDPKFKAVLEFQKGYSTRNYFNKNDIVLGFIPNNTNSTINSSTTEHVSGKVYLNAGDYSLYGVNSDIYGYIQLYDVNGNYIRTERYFNSDLNFNWNMPQDGYVIMDVDRRVNTPIDQIMLGDYDPMFNEASNLEMFGTYQEYRPFNKEAFPDVVIEATEQLNDADKWVNPTVADAYSTDWYIDLDTNGEKYLSVFDEWGTGQFNSAAAPQIIEFDNTDTEIATQTATGNFVGEDEGFKWKRWRLNDSTVKVRFTIPTGNAVRYGTITRQKIQDNYRINLGAYFTQETNPYRVASINGALVAKRFVHPLKGKVIGVFGDSITDEKGTIGSRSSITQTWVREKELTVFNYAEGSAGLTDWNDTNVVTDGSPTTNSHDNVVSNQIEEMIFNGVNPDIALVTGGTNDSFRNRLKGNITTAITNYNTPNSQDRETYYGMFFWAVKRLRDYNINSQIALYKPVKGVPEGDFTAINTNLATVWEAYDEVSEHLGTPVIDCKDLLTVLGTVATNPYYEDALHPSVLAKEKVMSPYILEGLEKLNY